MVICSSGRRLGLTPGRGGGGRPRVADGTGVAAAHVLPRSADGQVYPTYTAAIEALDRPALFENRVCYRLLDAELAGPAHATRDRATHATDATCATQATNATQ